MSSDSNSVLHAAGVAHKSFAEQQEQRRIETDRLGREAFIRNASKPRTPVRFLPTQPFTPKKGGAK